jgi:succinoglycan biosynthesis transport protein ExoP
MTRAADQISPMGSTQSTDEIDLIALLSVLWRGKWWIMLAGILGITAMGYYGFRVAVPMYPARVTIALEAEGQSQVIGDIESIFAGGGTDTTSINTEIEVLRSRVLIERLVDTLDLTQDPEFNGSNDGPSLVARLRMAISDWTPVERTGDALRNRVVDLMIARLSISNIRQSLAFNIQIETRDPARSAQIVNTLAQIYIENSIRRKLDDATRAVEFLSERTTELQGSFEMLQQDLAQRIESSNVINADLLAAQNLQLRDLRERADEAQMRLTEDQGLLDALAAADGVDAMIDVAESSADGRLAGIVQRYRRGTLGEDAALLALEAVSDDLRNDLRRTQTQLTSLQRSATDLTEQITTQSDELIQIQQLEREVEAARLLYETFLTRLQEASVQRGLETADSRILSMAVPRTASSPRILVMMMIGAVLGGLVGMALVTVREWRFAGFRTTEELRSAAGTFVFGSLPAMSVRGRRDVLSSLKSKPNSVFAEAVRNLRTSILMANPDKEPQVILVTSSIPGEGKTTLSLALARYFGSLEGRRVLLVEADIRRQTLRAYIEEERPRGVQLLDVLLGKQSLDGADLTDPDLGVEVLMGSGGEFNAADLFESRRFRDLIENLRTRYDHIIIDSAPVLAVPDARVLTRYADVSVFAVRWGSTSRTQVKQGLEMLKSVGHPANGVVLTQVDQKKMKGYGYAGQYGYDDYSSKYYNDD